MSFILKGQKINYPCPCENCDGVLPIDMDMAQKVSSLPVACSKCGHVENVDTKSLIKDLHKQIQKQLNK